MYTNSEINFQTYRNDLNRPSPEKDLSTFIDQMQRVSVQVGRRKLQLIHFNLLFERGIEIHHEIFCLSFFGFPLL